MSTPSDHAPANLAVEPVAIGGQQTYDDTIFPYVLVCADHDAATAQAVAWVTEQRDELLQLSTQHGAVLLRGFPTPTVAAFDAVISSGRRSSIVVAPKR